jgi:hypothetical protein
MSGPSELESRFGALEEPHRQMLDDLGTDQLRVIKALAIAKEAGVSGLSSGELSKALHLAGVDLGAVGVTNSLRAARGLVAKRRVGKKVSYSLMTAGSRRLAAAELKLADGQNVVAISAGQIHSARRTVGAVLAEFDGVIRASDPYFGRRTLDLLAETKSSSTVRFLTMRAARGPQSAMEREAADFCKQYRHVEIRVAPVSANIAHDRFIATTGELVLVGHGLNDVGARDSYIVRIDGNAAPGLLADSIARFDRDWTGARVVA